MRVKDELNLVINELMSNFKFEKLNKQNYYYQYYLNKIYKKTKSLGNLWIEAILMLGLSREWGRP